MRLPEALTVPDKRGMMTRTQEVPVGIYRPGDRRVDGVGAFRVNDCGLFGVAICVGNEVVSARLTREQFGQFLADGLALWEKSK